MENTEFEKSKTFTLVEALDYIPNSITVKNIAKKITGNISVIAFDSGETLKGKISAFDTFIQVIDGKAEIAINNESNVLETGQAIIIPAHTSNTIKANVRFKILSIVIKSGYEDLI